MGKIIVFNPFYRVLTIFLIRSQIMFARSAKCTRMQTIVARGP